MKGNNSRRVFDNCLDIGLWEKQPKGENSWRVFDNCVDIGLWEKQLKEREVLKGI